MKKLNKRGAAWVWLAALAGVVVVIMAYIVFSYPISILIDYANETLAGTVYLDTLEKLQTVWLIWPLVLVFAAALLTIAWSLKRDAGNQYG